MDAVINSAEFTPIPPGLNVAFAAFIATLLLMVFNGRADKERTGFNKVMGVFILMTAATIPIALASLPLFTSFAQSLQSHLVSGNAANGVVSVLLGIAVAVVGLSYLRNPSKGKLFFFVVAVAVTVITAPALGSILAWWLNVIVLNVWNFVFNFLTMLLNIELNF